MIEKVTFSESLRKIFACPNAVKWVGDKTLAEAWRTCKQANWMLWLCGKHIGEDGWPSRQEIVLAVCDCAETAKHLWSRSDTRPAKVIKTARAWARGDASLEEVRVAYIDATDAASDDVTAASAVASAVAYAVFTVASADAADLASADAVAFTAVVSVAAVVAYTAAYAAYASDASAVRQDTHLKMCTLIRDRLHQIGSD